MLPVPVLRLPDIHPLMDAEYTPYDIGVMGELDVRILTKLFGGREMAEALAPAWNGGIYYAAQTKVGGDCGGEGVDGFAWAAVLLAVEESGFGAIVSAYLCGADAAEVLATLRSGQKDEADENEQVYTTSEGDVLISMSGTGVFVGEGFDLALARKLRDSIVSVQPEGPMQSRRLRHCRSRCALRWRGCLRSFGVGATQSALRTIYF